MTDRNDSLFTYLPYENFDGLRNTSFSPAFTADTSSTDVSVCNGDQFCIFDVVATGVTGVGVATMAAVAEIQQTEQLSYSGKCVCVCVCVRVHVQMSM